MKRILLILLAVFLLIGLTACGGNSGAAESTAAAEKETAQPAPAASDKTEPAAEQPEAEPETEPAAEPAQGAEPVTEQTQPAPAGANVLVVVFSATGTTRGVAEKIAALENADLYEIKAAQEYTSADLNWNDSSSRTTKEQNDKAARPEIGSEPVSLEGYTKIYVGYPIWWGEEPRILDTFAGSCDFTGKTVIPFCTSGGSGIGRSGQNLEELAGSGTWLEGKRLSSGVSDTELLDWIDSLES